MATKQITKSQAAALGLPATPAPLAQVAATLVAAPAAAPAKPVTVALRGGAAVASVALGAKPYRTACPHNTAWWESLTKAMLAGGGQISVAAILATPQNPAGVPSHFVGYALRKGYLKSAA